MQKPIACGKINEGKEVFFTPPLIYPTKIRIALFMRWRE
jgi:hypothetical protein